MAKLTYDEESASWKELMRVGEIVDVQLEFLYQQIDEEFDLNDFDSNDPMDERFVQLKTDLMLLLADYIDKYRQ